MRDNIPIAPTTDEIIENFGLLGDWEERYRYLITLGKNLPPMEESLKTPENRVNGCTSQVWLTAKNEEGFFSFFADSDTVIVKGLVAVILIFYSGKTAPDILAADAKELFSKLELQDHLTPSRSNGFFAMEKRIKDLVTQAVGNEVNTTQEAPTQQKWVKQEALRNIESSKISLG